MPPDAQYFGVLNPLKVLKYKDNYSLTKPFTRADFQTCYCHLILTFFYNQLVKHYRGSGNKKGVITFQCIELNFFRTMAGHDELDGAVLQDLRGGKKLC